MGKGKELNNEEMVMSSFQQKNWHEIKSEDSWRIFKIMSEFVEGFEKMSRIGPCVSIFGSARTSPESPFFKLAEDIAFQLTKKGFGIITGGGPGIMEAGNIGAKRGKGRSVGINISLPFEQEANFFIDPDKLVTFDHFFVRKVMFMKYAQGFVVLPGGFGTFDELFEAMTLIQTRKIGRFPIVLVGHKFWDGLVDWINTFMLESEHNISKEDMDLFSVVDTAEEAVEIIDTFYSKYMLSPNF